MRFAHAITAMDNDGVILRRAPRAALARDLAGNGHGELI